MKDGTVGFMSSSGVCNIVMTSFLGKERSFIPVFTPLDVLYLFFSFFWPQTAPFSVKITQNVSRPAAVSRCLIGQHSESISLSLSGSRAHCSDGALSFRLRCSIIRGWGLHHQVPSSEEFIQPLPQWVLCVVAPHLLSLFLSSPFHLPHLS